MWLSRLRERVLGRVVATPITKPGDDTHMLLDAGTLLDEHMVDMLEEAGVDENRRTIGDNL